MDRGGTILLFLAFIQGAYGQTVTLSVDPVVERGRDTVFTCTGDTPPYSFTWQHVSESNAIIFNDGEKSPDTKYGNFTLSGNGDMSIMTIKNTRIEDEGEYSCVEGTAQDTAEFTVEVRYTVSLAVESTLANNIDMYEATCEALNGRPDLPITWMLGDSGSPCDNTDETTLQADEPGLFSKRSVCTFQATSENYGEILRCNISGYQLLIEEKTFNLSIHSAPASTGIMTVGFQFLDPDLTVSCDIADNNQPNPIIRNYYIYSNDSLIPQSDRGVNSVVVPETQYDIYTEFHCVAGNYLGNTTSPLATYDPDGPTTPSPTTESSSTEGPSPSPTDDSGPGGLSDGAIAGIAIGAVLLIVIIILIIYFVCIRGTCSGNPGPSGASSTKKHGSSTVGTSNGSEKDKIKPVAAPRDQGSIQHTTDNPGQAEYAMVDRKKPGGGDMPDTRGPGQKEPPQGMLYADLDLSASAGHTEKKVPQNKDDVVVYSSILV